MSTMKSMTQFFFAALTSTLMACSVFASTAAPKLEKPDLAKGEAIVGGVCAACHMADGNSTTPVNPKLAQQHPEYIMKQLQEFKSGKRANAVMMGFASQLSDADMRNVAYFLASKTAKPGFAKEKESVALGEKIYRGGYCRSPDCSLCGLPRPQWFWHACPVSPHVRPTR
jgi:cytochrome c553